MFLSGKGRHTDIVQAYEEIKRQRLIRNVNNKRGLTAEICSWLDSDNHVVDSNCYINVNVAGLILRRILIRAIRLGNTKLACIEVPSRRRNVRL